VVAIANKDRSAIFLAGRDARHAAYWYSAKTGTYATSAAYDEASPTGAAVAAVVARFNTDEAGANLASHLGTTWSRLPEPNPVPLVGFESGLAAYQDAIDHTSTEWAPWHVVRVGASLDASTRATHEQT
jgi:pyruvoyl-dependent arginine decarboxylase (PvlArgDC)